jgi:RimJ/RimL family protein N-acetyltransferase
MNHKLIDNTVLLRDVTEDDLPTFFDQQQDQEANQMAAVPAREKEDFWAHWRKNMGNEQVILKAVLFNGQVAGNLVSWQQDGERMVGYWLGKEYWGLGIATKALADFLVQVSDRPLTAHVAKHNFASFRVLEKCGFVVVGEENEPYRPGDEPVPTFIMRLVG